MKIKLDENLPVRLVGALEQHGHETDTVIDENLAGFPDEAVWLAAGADHGFSSLKTWISRIHASLYRAPIPGFSLCGCENLAHKLCWMPSPPLLVTSTAGPAALSC
jgi:hypothetical protein